MGLTEFYHGLEDKYYAGLDWLDKHGIPVYSVVDAIEAQNIPSFPIAALVMLLIVGGLWVFVSPALLGGNATLTIIVQDDTQTPIQGISVQLSGENLSGDAQSTRLTDDKGRVTFTGLPIGESITISANHDEYAIAEKSMVLDQGNNERKLVATLLNVTKSISLQLYKTNTTETFSAAIPLEFSCSNDDTFTKTSTVAGGQITLNVPSSCGTLHVISLDSTLTLQNATVDVEDNNPRIYVNAQLSGDATLRINLLNESGNGISGLTTMLKSKFGDVIATKFSDATGFVEFTGLVADTYTVYVASDGTYGELDSGSIEVNDAQPVEKTLTIPLASIGEVRLQFVDEGNLSPVNGAKVTLSRGNQIISTKTTNDGGQVTFSVSSPTNLSVSVDHPTYLVRAGISVSVSSAGYSTIALTKATLQNSQIVTLKIVDELNQPVENAYVSLKKSPSGTSIGTNKVTGASGTVQFTSLEEGTYFASAYKPGFSDQIKSDLFSVRARENVESTIKLVIGNGNVSLVVKDTSGTPLAGASIQAVDGITHVNVGNEMATSVDGSAELTLRADRYVYFVIDEPNHVPYVTLPTQVKKGITQVVNVEMMKDISKLEIRTLSTSVNGKPILEDSGLAPGQTYTIRFALMVPRNTAYTETGVHIRTGNSNEGQTNPIENDAWYIRDVKGAFAKLQKGTTYTPSNGLGVDSQHVTSADAKWANVTFNPVHEGVTIIEAELVVRDTATQGGDLPLYYRAWARTGSYVRFPVDAVLGGSESTSQKQGLYANANVKLYSTGASSHVCTNDFCLGLVGEDLANGIQTSILDDYSTDISSKQKVLFTFTSLSDNVFADTSLILQSTTSSATLNAYDVTNAVGAKKTGVVSGNKVEIPIGTIQKNNVVFGYVNVDASKEGTSRVKFSLVSSKKEVYAREIIFKVSAAGTLDVEIVPKAILPLLTNQLLVHVTQDVSGDGVALENASVSVKLNDTLLTSGFTDAEGVYAFELNEPNVNDEVEITAQKQGFKPVTLMITVGEDIVSFIPAQLNESLIVNGTTRKTRDIHMLNVASIPLTIKEVTLSGDFSELVKFDLLNEEIIGDVLGVNQDRNVTIALSLTEKGQNLLTSKTLKGSVIVKLASETSEKTFTNALPLTLKIGFGGEVDVEDCLLIEPLQWDVYADPKEVKQQAFEIRNTCTVKSVPVKLTNLSAKIKQLSGDALGVFTLVSSQKSTELGSSFKTILNELPANGEVVVTASFSPDQIVSGLATPQIIFQATNLTDNGTPDLIEESVKVNLVVNALSKCVQVKTPSVLEIDSCAINTGMGNLGSYYNQVYRPTGVPYYNPSYSTLNNTTNPSGSSLLPSNQSGGAYGSYNYGNGYFSPQYGASGYDGYGAYANGGSTFNGSNYSSMQGYYGNPYVDRYNYGAGAGASFGCGNSEIRIENSCQSEIEIQLDADPNVQVNKSSLVLKPNQTERIRVGSGYRIGKYPVYINARANGSKDASLDVGVVDVLIKSPTEVNADCITLNNTKYRFNELLQKPVKGKAINKCYNSGVRLIPSADTITIASYFNVDDQITLTEKGSVKSRKNTMAHDIQLIGVQTRGEGRDTIQELEFQIFPDFETYKRVLSPFTEQAGVGQTLLDLKLFIEGQYYRAESYGTISVKYLDAYGGSQQKPFPVIFENLWRVSGLIDMGDGNPSLTNFQECINEDALQYESVNTQTNNKTPITLTDEDFKNANGATTTSTIIIPSKGNEVLKVGDQYCGGRDTLNTLKTTTLTSKQNPAVKATFTITGDKHNIQVEITRPNTLNTDAIIEGTLDVSVTRTAFNVNTKKVTVPVRIVVSKPGKSLSTSAFQPLACTIDGFEKGNNVRQRYGFDKLSWNWTWENSPDCTENFCDGTQFTIWLMNKVDTFNQMVKQNKASGTGVFSGKDVTYDTLNFLPSLVETKEITDNSTPNNTKVTLVLNTTGGILETPPSSTLSQWKADAKNLLKLDEDNADAYVKAVDTYLNDAKNKYSSLYAGTVLVFDATKVQQRRDNFGTVLELLGAEKITVTVAGGDTSSYVWTMSEFLKLHQRVREQIGLIAGTSGPSSFAMDAFVPQKWPVKNGTIDMSKIPSDFVTGGPANTLPVGDARVSVNPEMLRIIGESLEDVVVGYVWNANDPTLKSDASVRKYVLTNAKLKNDTWYQPFGSAEEVLDTFLNAEVYLTKERFSEDLFRDVSAQTLAPYAYVSELNERKIPTAFASSVMFRSAKDKADNALTPPSVNAGKYPVNIYLSWTGNATGEFVVESVKPFIDATNFTPLAEITTQEGAELDYEKNPFFSIPFNGTTGLGTADGRNSYGSSLAYRANGTLSAVSGNPHVNVALENVDTLEGLSTYVEQTNTPQFASLENSKLTLAPSIPVALKARVSNSSAMPALQYYFTVPSSVQNPIALPTSPIIWNDCTSTTGGSVSVQMNATCNAALPASQSLVGSAAGSELFYRGLALVPTSKAYHLGLACADETATITGPTGTSVSVDAEIATNVQTIPLTNPNVTKVSTLKEVLDQVYKGDACGRFDEDTFSIIWDVTSPKVVPANLQCTAN